MDSSGWIATSCALCGGSQSEPLHQIVDRSAPGGRAAIVRCPECGLRRLDPRPSDEAVGGYYGRDYNSFAGRTRGPLKQLVWDQLRDLSSRPATRGEGLRLVAPLARRLAARIFDIDVPLDGRRRTVLDVGSGYGDLLIYLASRGCRVQGVDADPRAAETAREYGIPVLLEDPARLPLPARSVDATILCHSLEHLPHPERVLEEVARLSRPGGELHIAVPNGASAGLALEGSEWGHVSFPLHFWYFDDRSLSRLLVRSGFEPVATSYRMTWGFQWGTWRRERRRAGLATAARTALMLTWSVTRDPRKRDVLRVVARRRER